MLAINSSMKWWALFLLAAACGTAEAATLVYSDTVVVRGTHLEAVELALDAPGPYRITATDHEWFDTPLEALSFGVFTATGPIATHQGAGVLEFFHAGPGKVFLQVFAVAGGARQVGLVHLQTELVVPLPPSLLLLASSLLGWWGIVRRAPRVSYVRHLRRM